MNRDKQTILNFTKQLSIDAAKIAVDMREKITEYSLKSPSQMVSEADKSVEKFIMSSIHSQFPEDLILAEESSTEVLQAMFTKPTWVIDPIDGTTNYLHHHKHVAISIAYMEEGQVQVGVVNMPFYGEIFSSIKGSGSILTKQNGQTEIIRCDKKKIPFNQALICLGRPSDAKERTFWTKSVTKIFESCFDVRRLAAAAGDISWIACDRLHAFWETLKPWDIAASCLIAKEAGAIVDYIEPLPTELPIPQDLYCNNIVVANPSIHQDLMKLLRSSL